MAALLLRDHRGSYWFSSWRHFINLRVVEICIDRHCQGSRDRRCSHDQLVGHYISRGFFLQRQSLIDTKTVLFIDDNKAQGLEQYTGLKQGMRANHNICFTRGNRFQFLRSFSALVGTRQTDNLQTHRREPFAEIGPMLLGQNLGWRHQCTLKSGFYHRQAGERGNHCFSTTNVTLEQAHHWLAAFKILHQFFHHTLLSPCQLEWQLVG